MVLRVNRSQWLQACHKEGCSAPFCLSYIPEKYLSWLSTDYLPMQMTPHYWQLFASQQTDLLLLFPLTGTWLGFRSCEITGAQCWILTILWLQSLVDPGLQALSVVTCLVWGFYPSKSQPRHPRREVWQQAHIRRPCAWYCFPCLSENLYLEVGEAFTREHLCATSLLFCICSPNPWVLFSGVGVSFWMSHSASWAPGVFGGQALALSGFYVVVSSTSCGCMG